MAEPRNESAREAVVGNETPVAGYEPPRVESVLTPEDVEREALYGGITRA